MSVGCLPSCQGSGGHSRASNGISNRPFTALSLSLSLSLPYFQSFGEDGSFSFSRLEISRV